MSFGVRFLFMASPFSVSPKSPSFAEENSTRHLFWRLRDGSTCVYGLKITSSSKGLLMRSSVRTAILCGASAISTLALAVVFGAGPSDPINHSRAMLQAQIAEADARRQRADVAVSFWRDERREHQSWIDQVSREAEPSPGAAKFVEVRLRMFARACERLQDAELEQRLAQYEKSDLCLTLTGGGATK